MSKWKDDTAEAWQASHLASADMNYEGHYVGAGRWVRNLKSLIFTDRFRSLGASLSLLEFSNFLKFISRPKVPPKNGFTISSWLLSLPF